ncbi:hypothetical protein [Musicola paradisiaca]|uniref:hypothetical protein n=1 Tax=Musicola paradisiaca TaxID=69223 RepID=UPI000309E218|nr:hypothetical protein [Musicola paradisiaca]
MQKNNVLSKAMRFIFDAGDYRAGGNMKKGRETGPLAVYHLAHWVAAIAAKRRVQTIAGINRADVR